MTHGSLFSGIGGFDLAAEWMGWENKFHCEINPFGQKILKYYWPNATSYEDITKTDFSIHRSKIDILTGGFPCQPYSQAGKRKGKEDDRHLWPQMLRAIREIQPCWVVGENVRGITNWNGGMVFDEVQADLEAEGYEVLPFLLPACAVNAPHRRDRIWFIAYSNNTGNTALRSRNNGNEQEESSQWGKPRPEFSGSCFEGSTSNTNSNGFNRSNSEHEINTSQGRINALHDVEQNATDYPCGVMEEPEWQQTNVGKKSSRQQARRFDYGASRKWDKWPTQCPIRRGNDGLPDTLVGITISRHTTESIKAYGNAVVPQIVYQIFKAIEQFEQNQNKQHGKSSNQW